MASTTSSRNKSPASRSLYDYDHIHMHPNSTAALSSSGPTPSPPPTPSSPRSPDISPFLSPPISSLTIAGSSQYVTTYLSLLGVCIMSVIVAESDTILQAVDMNGISPGIAFWLEYAPWLLERTFCYGGLALSITALSRRFVSQRQEDPDSVVNAGHISRFRRVMNALCYPTHLIEACLIHLLLSFVDYFLFLAGWWAPAIGAYYQVIAFPFDILRPLSIVHFWNSCTEAHSTSPTAIGSVDRSAPALSLARLWRGCVSIGLLLLTYSLHNAKWLISTYAPPNVGNLLGQGFSNLALIYFSCVLSYAIAAIVLLTADRHQIRARQVDFKLPYFALLLAFQLLLPYFLYESWHNYFMPFYGCSTSTIHKSLALVGYHLLLNTVQLVVRILSLLCVVPQHSLAMIYYVQWFEDFMADLTFFSVEPFSPLFFLNAVITMIRSLIRDCNGIRFVVRAGIRYHRSRTQQAKKHSNNNTRANITTTLSISMSPVTATINSTMTESLSRPNKPDPSSSAPDESSGSSNTSVLYILYQEYIKCFDLILTRHQTFLGESCSKCLIISVIVCQMLSTNAGTGGWRIDANNQEKLISMAGFGFLWFLQLLSHMIVLQILRIQQKPAATVYASAVSPTHECTSTSTMSSSSFSTISSTTYTQSPADCSCPSCILSYQRYIQALQQQQDGQNVNYATGRTYYATTSNATCCCCVSAPAAPAAALLPPTVIHPCINYWWIHRWFFAVQMMHWIWFVLADEEYNYEPCIPG